LFDVFLCVTPTLRAANDVRSSDSSPCRSSSSHQTSREQKKITTACRFVSIRDAV